MITSRNYHDKSTSSEKNLLDEWMDNVPKSEESFMDKTQNKEVGALKKLFHRIFEQNVKKMAPRISGYKKSDYLDELKMVLKKKSKNLPN